MSVYVEQYAWVVEAVFRMDTSTPNDVCEATLLASSNRMPSKLMRCDFIFDIPEGVVVVNIDGDLLVNKIINGTLEYHLTFCSG